MTAKRTWRWVTWTGECDYIHVWPLKVKPKKYHLFFLQEGGVDNVPICDAEFKRLFGFLPPLDIPIKVEFTAKVVK